MSRLGIAAFVLAGFCLGIAGYFKFIWQTWPPYMIYVLVAAGIFVAISIIKDRSLYWDFLTMRTTKHGMNMGALILLTLALLVSINYITYRHNKTFDMTAEGLNSLSDQSTKILSGLKDEVQIKLFYDPRDREHQRDKNAFRDVVNLYQEKKGDIKYEAVNVLTSPAIASEYGVTNPKATAFVVYNGRKSRLGTLDEQGLTLALINATREKKKAVYFTKGHGELPLEPDAERSPDISDFKQALLDNGYEVKPLDFMTLQKIPDDASVVAIIGPKNLFLENELKILRDYARAGGSLLIGADPGLKHDLGNFLKDFGVDFTNTYLFDGIGQQLGNVTVSVGTIFSSVSQAVKGLKTGNDHVFFSLATALKHTNPAPTGLVLDDIVKTTEANLMLKELPKGAAEIKGTPENKGPHVVGIEVKGKFAEKGKTAPPEQKEFSLIVFGDSEFLMGGLFRQDPNKNLGLNTVAALSKDADLVSIRPKTAKGVNLVLPRNKLLLLIFGVYIPMSLLLFVTGAVVWFRRRTA
ncbi:MAG: hypothetical protein A4S09_07250 [Proteobacteria bacterium SG_bin7]|nr:MAG: hypothetical protein A4S09_07250 [Proteobacteria bacterium SG_bin7]